MPTDLLSATNLKSPASCDLAQAADALRRAVMMLDRASASEAATFAHHALQLVDPSEPLSCGNG